VLNFYSISVLLHCLPDPYALRRQSLKEQIATVVRHYLDADFLKMLESKDEPHAGVVGSP
jgi:glycyl-tRNA synthetase beta subunit